MSKNNLSSKIHVAIDLGSSKTRIHIENIGFIYNESTIFARDWKTKKVLALGNKAKKFVGKLSGEMQVVTPIVKGTITNVKDIDVFLSEILNKYSKELKGSIVTLASPSGITKIQKEALTNCIKKFGPEYVNVEDDILLSMYGAGVDVFGDTAVLGIDIGAGKTTCAIVFAGSTIKVNTIKMSGHLMDLNIIRQLREKNNFWIGELTAEKIKKDIATIGKRQEPVVTKIYGYETVSGMPKSLVISDQDISKVVTAAFNSIVNLITIVLEDTPQEMAGDVIQNSIVVTGGCAGIDGVKYFFEDFFDISVKIPKNFSTTVIDGAIAFKDETIKKINDGSLDFN